MINFVRSYNESLLPKKITRFMSKYDLSQFRKEFARNVDIQNTDLELTRIKNSRDPRLKDPMSILFFILEDQYGEKTVAVSYNNKMVVNQRVFLPNGGVKSTESMSWKQILDLATEVYVGTINPEASKNLQAIRNKRASARRGSIERNQGRSYQRLDKSGYVITGIDGLYKKLAVLRQSNIKDEIQKIIRDVNTKVAKIFSSGALDYAPNDYNPEFRIAREALDNAKAVQSYAVDLTEIVSKINTNELEYIVGKISKERYDFRNQYDTNEERFTSAYNYMKQYYNDFNKYCKKLGL